MNKIDDFISDASTKGLRTLLYAMKIIDADELHEIMVELENIHESLDHVDERTEKLFSKVESDLVLIGATAVEDRLQDNVPEVISDLEEAGIKIWMLTGDQFNTAQNIAKSCKLIKQGFEVYKLRTPEQVE